LPEAALRSALDQAVRDAEARRAGRPVLRAFGEAKRTAIPVYANINRRTIDRSPEGFAQSARTALAAGHDAFKLAPFDEATPEAVRAGEIGPVVDKGFARAAAVREEIGPRRRLMIDCHWRFDEALSRAVIERAAELALHWVECPMPETAGNLVAIRRLRSLANSKGIALAGCEQAIGLEGFLPFLDAGAYDVLMPDVKYIGGLHELIRLADASSRRGVAISPHNPSGPVCHAMSLQMSAVLVEFDRLETQFDESPLFASLVGNAFRAVVDGMEALPDGNGCGVKLDCSILAGVATRQAVYKRGAR
jgi:galactonate dehydratase